MINLIRNLTVFQVLAIYLGLLTINLLFIFVIKHLVSKKYEETQAVEQTLYFQMKLSKYVQSILIIVTAFVSSFIATPKLKRFGDIEGFLMLMAVLIGTMILIAIINQLVMHDLNAKLRKTTSTKGEQIKLLMRILLFTFIPMMLFFVIIMLLDDNLHVGKQLEAVLEPALICTIYIAFSVILPAFTKYMIKAVPMEDGAVKEELNSFLNNAGLPKAKLYLWTTKKNKVANALVSGLITKNIYISDYLLENLDMEETKSVLAHEIGHIMKHHLWIRTGLILGMIITFSALGSLFDWYEANNHPIPIWLGLSIFVVILIIYMGFFMYFIKRVQERQADNFVFSLNIHADVYIKALYKLTRLNNMVMKFGKMDEKFQTHPSTAKRIKWIMEKSQISDEAFEEIRSSILL